MAKTNETLFDFKKTREQVQEEALSIVKKHRRSGLDISMGVGKTKIGLDHFQLVINKIQKVHSRDASGLVVGPTKKILNSWKDEIKKWGYEHMLPMLHFVTYRSLPKADFHHDVVYLDECHSLTEKCVPFMNAFTGWVLGLTGTPSRPGTYKRRLIDAYCPIVYSYLINDAVNDAILNDYRITVHLLPLSEEKNYRVTMKSKHKDPKKRKVIRTWLTSEVENYAYWTDKMDESDSFVVQKRLAINRMKCMQRYPTKDAYAKKLLNQSDRKALLFTNEKEQADDLCKHTYHSSNKAAERNMDFFVKGSIRKLACVLQLSEGANIPDLEHTIIMHMYGNNVKGPQRMGRTLRLNPDAIADIDILCFKGTIDVKWVKRALAGFNPEKITWYDPDEF